MAEQQLTSEEVIERLQETVTLVDKLREMDNLERRLSKVRDLEERLQEVDEMAERLQEVIEEELGKEEVDQLREVVGELEQDVQAQAEAITEMVVKRSVQRIERKEDEVDELEDEIKQVFLKGLLPEEEEEEDVEVKQVSKKEVTVGRLFDDGLRKEKIENEWKIEVEERSDSSDVAGTMSVVAYQKVERRTKKRVTYVEKRGPRQKEMEDSQLQTVVLSEETIRQTEILEDITERELTERLRPGDPSQVADKDVWFILFDCPPYKAVFKPPGKVFSC